MAWQFEKVYEATTPTAPKTSAFDGRYLWVTGTNAVYIYEFFGESSGHEPAFEELDQLNLNKYNSKLVLVKTVAVPVGAYWIVADNDSIYISNAANFSAITQISIATQAVVQVIVCPEEMCSNLNYENGKLWMASKNPTVTTDRQLLYFYNIATKTFGSSEIPTRKQLARIVIARGFNGSVYVTNFNNVAICKFNSETGAFQTSIRTNAFPTIAFANSNRELFVGSYAGMLSKVNTTDNTVTHPHSTLETATSIAHEPGTNFIWFLNSTRLGRLNTTDNSIFFSEPFGSFTSGDDWTLGLDNFSDKSFSRLQITTPFSYKQLVNGVWKTINVKPYLVLIGATKIMAVRLDRALYREGNISVEGRAMISSGPEDYMGEVG